MSFDGLLIDTCTIQRFTFTSQDEYGQPVKKWADLHVGELCRFTSESDIEIKVGQEVVLVKAKLFINDIDVTERDRVNLGGRLYEILSVVACQDGIGVHHKECLLGAVM